MLGWVRLRLKLRLNQSVAYQHSMITCQSADDNIHCFHCLCFHGDREFFCVRCVHRPIWWIRMWSNYCEWRQRFAQRDICISNVRKSRGSRTSVSVHVYRRPRGTRSSGLPRLQSTRNATRVRFFLFLTILSKFYVFFLDFPPLPFCSIWLSSYRPPWLVSSVWRYRQVSTFITWPSLMAFSRGKREKSFPLVNRRRRWESRRLRSITRPPHPTPLPPLSRTHTHCRRSF